MATTGTTFRRLCALDEPVDPDVESDPDPDAAGDVLPPPRGRCAGLRLLVDGCRRGSVSCSVYASEWTNARVSCW